MPKKFFTLPNIISAVVVSFLSAGVFLVFADWSAPPTAPPSCPASEPGCNLPLNVGGAGQIKAGGLALGASLNPSDTGLMVLNGNVGIGTTAPGQKLTVAGIIEATGGVKFPDATTQTTAFLGNADTVGHRPAGTTAIYACPVLADDSLHCPIANFHISGSCKGQLSTISTCNIVVVTSATHGMQCGFAPRDCAVAGYLLAP